MFYDNQDPAQIEKLACIEYGWKRPKDDKFFEAGSWANSDNEDLLTKAATEHLSPNDILLTIPGYEKLFEDVGVKNIRVYDISVARLKEDKSKERYWCDITSTEQLEELLKTTHATAINLSNITDHIKDKDVSTGVAQTIDSSKLQKVIVTRLFSSEGFELFVSNLEERGWKSTEYSEQNRFVEKTVVLNRK